MKGFTIFLLVILGSAFYGSFFPVNDYKIQTVSPSTPRWEQMVETAPSGSVIYFQPGIYFLESLFLYKKQNVSLVGLGKVDFMGYRADANILTIQYSTNIQVHNIYMKHFKSLGEKEAACTGDVISIHQSANLQIYQCRLEGSGVVGIRAEQVRHLSVLENTIQHNTAWALNLWDTEGLTLVNNVIRENGGAIFYNGLQMRADPSRWDKGPDIFSGNAYLSNRIHPGPPLESSGVMPTPGYFYSRTNDLLYDLRVNQYIRYVNPKMDWQSVIEQAKPGDVIEFTPGTYKGSIYLSNQQNIRLLSSKGVVVHSAGIKHGALLLQHCRDISIEGFHFEQGNGAEALPVGYIQDSQDISINESVFRGKASHGLQVLDGYRIKIDTCTINGANDWALTFSRSYEILIIHNTFSQNGRAILLNGHILGKDTRQLEPWNILIRNNIYHNNKNYSVSSDKEKIFNAEAHLWKESFQ